MLVIVASSLAAETLGAVALGFVLSLGGLDVASPLTAAPPALNVLCGGSGLLVGWQRVRLFDVFWFRGLPCATRVFENPHPIPCECRCFKLYDPGQSGQYSRGALPSDAALRQRALEVLKLHASVNSDYHGAQHRLLAFRDTVAQQLKAYMPSNVYSPVNTSLWYDINGNLALARSG